MNTIAKDAVTSLVPVVDVQDGCDALGFARSSFYYAAIPADQQHKRGGGLQPNALSDDERIEILSRLDSERLCDSSPRQAHASLLDDGVYLGSPRTFARVLASNDQSADRRLQRPGVARVVPMLCAIVPNDIWTWDTSPLATTVKRVFIHLYVILDIYSRFAVDWSVETAENSLLAETLFLRACERDGVDANALIVHSDNGPIQRSNVIDDCFSELGITKSYSRPHVSNDNPYSESLFKTAKYQPEYPDKFETIEQARQWANDTFTHYNYELYHSGIAMLTPASVHFGTYPEIIMNRQFTLDEAYLEHPERFRNSKPTAKSPGPAWINKPAMTPDEKEAKGA
jgi:putative transposase